MSVEWVLASLLFFGGLYALYYFLKSFIDSTVKESIAHQFDIKLEQFKQEFTRELHELDRKDKFKLAALDKKLEAYQKAFKLARIIENNSRVAEPARGKIVEEMSNFIDDYFMYLSTYSKEKFSEAFFAFKNYPFLQMDVISAKQIGDGDEFDEAKKVRNEAFQNIINLKYLLLKDVDSETNIVEDAKNKPILEE